jgi:transposase
MRTGAPWRDLPRYFGRWNSVYKRFRRWCLGGVWRAIWQAIRRRDRVRVALLDSTIMRAHQHSAGGRRGAKANAIGRSRGGRTSKLHVVVSADQRLLAYALSAGAAADVTLAPRLLRALPRHVESVVGDRAYDCNAILSQIASRGAEAVIPPRRHRRQQRPWSRGVYGQRHVVENYFAWLKHQRRLATRYDKRRSSFEGFFLVANVLLEVRRRMPRRGG